MSDKKAIIKTADMLEDMQQDSVDFALEALEKFSIEKDIAAHIKKEMDKKHKPTWHCIVGKRFGSYVTHETRHFIYFYIGHVAILLFKSGQLSKGSQKLCEEEINCEFVRPDLFSSNNQICLTFQKNNCGRMGTRIKRLIHIVVYDWNYSFCPTCHMCPLFVKIFRQWKDKKN